MLKIIITFFIVLAAGSFAWDVWDYANTGHFRLAPFGERWFLVHSTSLQLFEPAITRHISPALWDNFFLHVLVAPAVIVFSVLAAIFDIIRRVAN